MRWSRSLKKSVMKILWWEQICGNYISKFTIEHRKQKESLVNATSTLKKATETQAQVENLKEEIEIETTHINMFVFIISQ